MRHLVARIRCTHANVRCIHGDEIIARMSWRGVIRRASCLDCGRALDRGLPDYCWFTAASHYEVGK